MKNGLRMAPSSFICPYCFASAEIDDIMFQCANTGCVTADRVFTEFLLDRPLQNSDRLEKKQTVFSLKKRKWFSFLTSQGRPICPKCHCETFIRCCPRCHSVLPHGIDELSDFTIAVIGAKESGKSHYIAVLVQQIKTLYSQFGWTLRAMNDETITLYDQRFYKPLYRNHLTIVKTQTEDVNVRKPLLYALHFDRDKVNRTIMLAFFDTAGEALDSEANMRKMNRYIFNASGVILLLDPLQWVSVRTKLAELDAREYTGDALPKINTEAASIMNRTATLIRVGRNIPGHGKIDIPFAVAFSKIDMLRLVIGEEAPLFDRPLHRGGFSVSDFTRCHQCVKNWTDVFDPTLRQGTGDFAKTAFFGLSALGCNPQQTQKLEHDPRPIRVEDPFLWILWQHHLIPEVQ